MYHPPGEWYKRIRTVTRTSNPLDFGGNPCNDTYILKNDIMFLNANYIYTLRCKTAKNSMLCAASTFQEVMAEAIVLCKATNEDVDIYCHGTASSMGNVTTEFVAQLA